MCDSPIDGAPWERCTEICSYRFDAHRGLREGLVMSQKLPIEIRDARRLAGVGARWRNRERSEGLRWILGLFRMVEEKTNGSGGIVFHEEWQVGDDFRNCGAVTRLCFKSKCQQAILSVMRQNLRKVSQYIAVWLINGDDFHLHLSKRVGFVFMILT
jgi:hypothetical protein